MASAVTALAVAAIALVSLSSGSSPSRSPHYVLTSGSSFSIAGTVYTTPSGPYPAASCLGSPALLYPATTRCMVFSVHNALKASITVQSITSALDPGFPAPPAACAGSSLSLPSFSGSLNVASGATVNSPGEPITLKDNGANQDACQGLTYHFVFSGTATYTEVYGTSTELVSSQNPSALAQAVTYTATVTATATASQDPVPRSPTGSVTFRDNGTTICNAVLVTSASTTTATATCSAPAYMSAGSHPITAAYTNSDGNFSNSNSGTLTQVVNPSNTTTALTASPSPSNYGQSVTLTATVTATSGPTPQGSVNFYQGTPSGMNTSLGSGNLNASGKSTLTTSNLGGGSDNLYAIYAGSSNDNGSTSGVITQTVNFTACIYGKNSGSLTVASGQDICVMSSGSVSGNITVNSGGRLDLLGGSAGSSITVNSGGALNIKGGSVSGNITVTSPSYAFVCGAKLASNISVSGSTAFVLIGDGGDDGTSGCAGNTVGGSITLTGNASGVEIGGNNVTAGVTLNGTTGAGAGVENSVPEIEKNTIGGSLSCSSNSPAPSNGGLSNTVFGKRSGQCTGGF